MSLWEAGAKLLGKVAIKGEKGAKLTVEFSPKVGKALDGSKSVIERDFLNKKVLSRPMAEANKSEAFAKKFGDVTYKTKEGKTASRFTYGGGKVHDHKLGESFSPREFPGRLSAARKEISSGAAKAATASKETRSYGGWGKMANYDEWKKLGKFAISKPLPFIIGGIYLKSKVTGQGLVASALGEVSGKDGVLNDVGTGALGKEDYESFRESFAAAMQELKSIYGAGKNTVGNVADELGNLYHGGKDELGKGYGYTKEELMRLLGPGYSANNCVVDENGQYVDTTTQPYPNMTSGNGGVTGQIGDLTKKLAGDGVTPMNLATLLLSGYMMFCRSGWMSKAAGMLMGGMTMKSVGNHRQQMMQNGQGQGQGYGQGDQSTQQARPEYRVAANENESRETYHVSRGI